MTKDEVIGLLLTRISTPGFEYYSPLEKAHKLYELLESKDLLKFPDAIPAEDYETNDWIDYAASPPGFEDEKIAVSVEGITEFEDGSADLILSMSEDALMLYAKIGITQVLKEAAERTLREQGL